MSIKVFSVLSSQLFCTIVVAFRWKIYKKKLTIEMRKQKKIVCSHLPFLIPNKRRLNSGSQKPEKYSNGEEKLNFFSVKIQNNCIYLILNINSKFNAVQFVFVFHLLNCFYFQTIFRIQWKTE